jgi:peptidyl-prolyl cis-trans isomerase SurA
VRRCHTVALFVSAAALFAVASVRAESIDRIAATVGRQVITESQVNEEIRVTAFLDAKAADWSEASRTRTTNRLVDQTLIHRELEATHFPEAPADEGAHLLEQLKTATPDFAASLTASHLSEAILIQHLQWHVTFLRFVEYRFRPGIQISEADLHDFYETQSREWRQQGKTVPSFEDARQDLERLLSSRYVDQALDRWLGDQRTQTQIVFKRGAKP